MRGGSFVESNDDSLVRFRLTVPSTLDLSWGMEEEEEKKVTAAIIPRSPGVLITLENVRRLFIQRELTEFGKPNATRKIDSFL